MTINNQARFKNGPHSKAWAQIAASDMFTEVVNAAMLIMVSQQGNDQPTAQFFRLEGARQIVGIMLNLTTERETPKIEDQNLRTNV